MATRTVETYENGELIATSSVNIPDEYDNAERIVERLQELLPLLEDADVAWATLDAAQKDAAARDAVVGVTKLIRHVMCCFDKA